MLSPTGDKEKVEKRKLERREGERESCLPHENNSDHVLPQLKH